MPRDDLSTAEGIRNARIRFRAEKIIGEMPDASSAKMVRTLLVGIIDDVHDRACDLLREEQSYGDEPPVWCKTCQHVHIPSIPVRTFRCSDEDRCGFGSWSPRIAQQHAAKEQHHVLPVVHRVRPLTDAERAEWEVERKAMLQEETATPAMPTVADLMREMDGGGQ